MTLSQGSIWRSSCSSVWHKAESATAELGASHPQLCPLSLATGTTGPSLKPEGCWEDGGKEHSQPGAGHRETPGYVPVLLLASLKCG